MKGYDGRDSARALLTALAAAALAAQITLSITEARERPWESATFSGARHVLTIGLAGEPERIGRWLDGLAEAELPMRHHIVADVTVTERLPQGAVIEALTVANV